MEDYIFERQLRNMQINLLLINSVQFSTGPNTEKYGPDTGFLQTANQTIRIQHPAKPYNISQNPAH